MFPYVETLKVGAAYAVLLYVWPCVLFHKALRDKGLTIRFLFCAMVQPVLLSTAVLVLGLFHILNIWLVRVLFWGALAVSLCESFWRFSMQDGASLRLSFRALFTGSYGWKLFFLRTKDAVVRPWKRKWEKGWRQYRKMTVEYLVLTAVLLFGMSFFLNSAFQDYSFGCYDQDIHYSRTIAMLEGQIFSTGISPEGMHCFLYAMHTLFGVKLHSCVLFLPGIHNSSVFLLAAYCLLKELFHSRYTPLLVLTAWTVFDGFGLTALGSMNRMTWMLPEEFAQHLVFLCPLVLLRHFREQDKSKKWYQDENLLLLSAGIALAASTHFYVLVMVFLSCCVAAIAYYKEIRPFRRRLPPVYALLYGVELGVLPMLAACAISSNLEGLPFVLWKTNDSASEGLANPDAASGSSPLRELYENGYRHLFGEGYAELIILLSLLVLVLAVGCVLYAGLRGKPAVLPGRMAKDYLFLTAALTVFVLLYAALSMGLPEQAVIEQPLGSMRMLAFGVAGIPLDLLIWRAGCLRGQPLSCRWMVLGCLFLYLLAYNTDFRQSTSRWLGRYNTAVTVTDQVMNRYPKGTYIIVSMRDEIYQLEGERHEELFTFLEGTEKEDYSIFGEYIFLYVEKHPIQRGQIHFLTAPRWLARDNDKSYEGNWNQSRCPNILKGEISQELAEGEFPHHLGTLSDGILEAYNDLTVRSSLCSRAYRWYQEFSAAHPAETSVYYEDDDFICYVIHQNPSSPLNLAIRGDRRG